MKVYIVLSIYTSRDITNDLEIHGVFKNKKDALGCIKDVFDTFEDLKVVSTNMDETYQMPDYIEMEGDETYPEIRLEIWISEHEVE